MQQNDKKEIKDAIGCYVDLIQKDIKPFAVVHKDPGEGMSTEEIYQEFFENSLDNLVNKINILIKPEKIAITGGSRFKDDIIVKIKSESDLVIEWLTDDGGFILTVGNIKYCITCLKGILKNIKENKCPY